jgi:hypothetical protein
VKAGTEGFGTYLCIRPLAPLNLEAGNLLLKGDAMIDVRAAYRPKSPTSPTGLVEALVQVGEDLFEMHVFGSWLEGKRIRYNLVQFGPGNSVVRDLRGWNGDLVQVLS